MRTKEICIMLKHKISIVGWCSSYNFPNTFFVVVVQLLSHVQLFVAHGLQHASLLCPPSPSLLKFMPFESVMLSNHLFTPYPISKLTDLGTPTCISRWPNFFLRRPREEGCDWSGCLSQKGHRAVIWRDTLFSVTTMVASYQEEWHWAAA